MVKNTTHATFAARLQHLQHPPNTCVYARSDSRGPPPAVSIACRKIPGNETASTSGGSSVSANGTGPRADGSRISAAAVLDVTLALLGADFAQVMPAAGVVTAL